MRRGRWRKARGALVVALVGAGAFTLASQWDTVEDAIGQLEHLRWGWAALAVGAEIASVLALTWLGCSLLRAGGRRISTKPMLGLTLASNALSVSLPGGPAWGAIYLFEQLRRRQVPRALAVCVPVSMGVVSAGALVVLLGIGVELAGGEGPAASARPLVIGLGLTAAVVGFACLRFRTRIAESRRLQRLRAIPLRLDRRAVLASFSAALANWITDCLCLAAAITAVSGHVPWQGLLVAYALGQVAENIPLTPGGVGIVEGALSLLLIAYGMSPATALASVLLYRVISFWIFVPIGWAAAAAMSVLDRSRERAPASARAGAPLAPQPVSARIASSVSSI